MNLLCRWKVLLISLWIQVGTVPGTFCKDATVSHLSREDVLLLKDEEDPKCFSRTEEEFTCFFETAENGIYDLLYTSETSIQKRFAMTVQKTEEGTFLHICSLPQADLYFFVEVDLEVVERYTNNSLYKRSLSLEEHILLDPPLVSLHQKDQAGHLQALWCTQGHRYCLNVMDRIRYVHKGLGEKTNDSGLNFQISKSQIGVQQNVPLDSVIPGQEVEVQVSVRCGQQGHWSRWSHPVQARVPQSADDASLICYTDDLQNITCQWNKSISGVNDEYRLSYKTCPSETLGWTEWKECQANKSLAGLCRFHGEETKQIMVKLSGRPAPLSRTFYTPTFTVRNSIKTSPPSHLTGTLEKDKLCLKWEDPLPSVSAHLQYEVHYQTNGHEWMTVSTQGPETQVCLKVSVGTEYSVKTRAKPTGPVYSGHWSDWSDVLTVETPPGTGMMFLLCIPLSVVIMVVILISSSSSILRKIKQYFWPPVPNLDKVLQGFLTEITSDRWGPPVTAKQCFEETTSSVVEIMSEDKISGPPSQGSSLLLSPQGSIFDREQADGSPETDLFPDYVTLNKDSAFLCPNGNRNVYEWVGERGDPEVRDELLPACYCSCSDGSVCAPPCLDSEYLNHSYLLVTEFADRFDCKVNASRGPGNFYTNFPCT